MGASTVANLMVPYSHDSYSMIDNVAQNGMGNCLGRFRPTYYLQYLSPRELPRTRTS